MHPRHRILIVDDHPTNVLILEEILAHDYHLKAAASGAEALAMALDFQPDLILLDIMMAGIDGYETCRQVRLHPALRHTKVIMVSAKAMVAERVRGYEAGADDYITKPFDEDELLAKVRAHLRLKSVEEVEQLKSNILTLLSHETRTPLNGILTPVQLLMDENDMAAEERTLLLEMVHESATRLQRLLDKVATLSAMLAGHWEVQRLPADLCAVICSAIDTVAPYAVKRAVALEQELPATAPALLDVPHMRNVFTALLDNALRFSPPESQVTVRVVPDGVYWCVTVTDYGEGIAPDMLPQVFETFVHRDLARHTEGHGLSLALARQVVLAHNGTIGVESLVGAGTTVTMRVPSATLGTGAGEGESGGFLRF